MSGAIITVTVALVLSACGGSQASPGGASASTDSTASTALPADGASLPGHVHNIAYHGEALLLGTHEGLWIQEPGQSPRQVSEEAFDVMGFTRLSDRWLASGHPAGGSAGPADIGLVQSIDQGVTWEPLALHGEVDFHRLVASGDRLCGIASADGALLRSDDAGRTWTRLGSPALYDLAADPGNPDVLLATSKQGLQRSTDGGATFTAAPSPSLIALLSWNDQGLIGVDVNGQALASDDGGSAWTQRGTLPGQPSALAADGDRVAALVGASVYESTDAAKTFNERIGGIASH